MLPRRRRTSASSVRPLELDGETLSRCETDVPCLRTSTETPTSKRSESSVASRSGSPQALPALPALPTRHVDAGERDLSESRAVRTNEFGRPGRPDVDPCVDGDRRYGDFSDSTSLTQQLLQQHNAHRQPPRPYKNSRRRRRKSLRILDSPSIVHTADSAEPSTHEEPGSPTLDGLRELPSRISVLDADSGRPDATASMPPKTAEVRTNVRASPEDSFVPLRPRLKNHEIQDFVHEHKGSRRRDAVPTTSIPLSARTAATSRDGGRTVWTQLTGPKCRYPVLLGLLLWTVMMIPEASARQNHHRTCPGCPHQHVHTINRKAANVEAAAAAAVASDDAETAPSPDDLRLEAIKHQILTKLGLRSRPDVNRTLTSVPRHLALETLYRTEAQPVGYPDNAGGYHEGRRRDHHRHEDNRDGDAPSSSSSASSSSDSSSSSSYGQYYYAGEEYSYRNVDADLADNSGGRGGGDTRHEASLAGHHFDDADDEDGGYARGRHGNAEEEGQVEMDDFYARTSEIITFAEPGCTLNGQPLLEFPRSSVDPALEPLRIKKATLWARVELRHSHHYQHHRRSQGSQRNITLWVFRVRCGNVTHLRGKELGQHLDMVTSLSVNVNQLGWQKFDVTKVVSNWYSGHESSLTRHEKLTLLVDCTGCGSHVHVSTFGVQVPNVVEASVNAKGEQDPDRPFLVVRTDPAAVKRVRRRAIECSGAVKGQCCKQRFYVSFSQLGWDDWIIAPQGYYANYCRGDCAARHRTPDTFLNYYTHVIEEFRKMDRLAGMQPCCAPVKFSPMSLIYYGPDSNIIKRDLPKMVVDECGCP